MFEASALKTSQSACTLQHWMIGFFESFIACCFTCCISSSRAFRTKTGSNHPPLTFPLRSNSAPPQSVRLHSSDCASSELGVSSRRGLTCVPLAVCIVRMRGLRRQPVAEDPRRSQSPDSHDDWNLPPVRAVREEAQLTHPSLGHNLGGCPIPLPLAFPPLLPLPLSFLLR